MRRYKGVLLGDIDDADRAEQEVETCYSHCCVTLIVMIEPDKRYLPCSVTLMMMIEPDKRYLPCSVTLMMMIELDKRYLPCSVTLMMMIELGREEPFSLTATTVKPYSSFVVRPSTNANW